MKNLGFFKHFLKRKGMVIIMAKLATEYTDIKEIRHKVEHIAPAASDESSRERIKEELCNILAKRKKVPA